MNAAWRAWVETNLKRKCNRFDMLRQMTTDGVPPDEAEAALQLPSMPLRPHSFALSNAQIRLFCLKRFLTPEQCGELCFLIAQKRRPSTVADGGRPGDRTSTTCDMYLGQHRIVDEVDARICARSPGLRTFVRVAGWSGSLRALPRSSNPT